MPFCHPRYFSAHCLAPARSHNLLWLSVRFGYGEGNGGRTHSSKVLLSSHGLPFFNHTAQELEVVDVEGGRVCVEELGFLVEGIRERMWSTDGHRYKVTQLRIEVRLARNVVTNGPLG